MEELSTELELADEDELVPYVNFAQTIIVSPLFSSLSTDRILNVFAHSVDRYKIGDSFMHLPLEEAQDLLSSATTDIEEEVSTLQEELGTVKDEIGQLKAHLYARFGRGINLEA